MRITLPAGRAAAEKSGGSLNPGVTPKMKSVSGAESGIEICAVNQPRDRLCGG